MQQLEFRAMGCTMLAAIDSDEPEDRAWLEEAPRWMADWESVLSRFRPDSELTALNGTPGRWTPVSAVLWAVLQKLVLTPAQLRAHRPR